MQSEQEIKTSLPVPPRSDWTSKRKHVGVDPRWDMKEFYSCPASLLSPLSLCPLPVVPVPTTATPTVMDPE